MKNFWRKRTFAVFYHNVFHFSLSQLHLASVNEGSDKTSNRKNCSNFAIRARQNFIFFLEVIIPIKELGCLFDKLRRALEAFD